MLTASQKAPRTIAHNRKVPSILSCGVRMYQSCLISFTCRSLPSQGTRLEYPATAFGASSEAAESNHESSRAGTPPMKADTSADPIGQALGQSRLGVGVVGGAHHGDEYLRRPHRSEEHTSELQSRLHLVCRLLL